MAVLIPASKIDAAQVTAMRLALRAKLLASVANVMGQSTVIRDTAAYDYTGAAAAAQYYARAAVKNTTVARTWSNNDFGAVTLAVNQAIGLYGITLLAPIPLLDAIAFSLGGVVVLAQFWVAPILGDQYSSTGYFNPPVVWGPQQAIQINILSETAITGGANETYALLGYTAEPAGKTVQADQTNLV
jgi:hypothetical protein